MNRIAVTVLLNLLIASTSHGASVAAYGDSSINAGEVIADLISTDFSQVLDTSGLVVVVQYDSTMLGADRVCHAITGLSRRPEPDVTAQVPAFRATHTTLMRNVSAEDGASQRTCMVEAVRGAVKTLTGIPIDVLLRGSKASVSDRAPRQQSKPALVI
ncbi:hypothetical protein ACN9M1_09810 [Ralstonia sp. R-29]|uniref:hypothetical protein n=1 Tax=Ralstonia sp. R-29 TaxID=3404059 RepID=UPI003CF0D548